MSLLPSFVISMPATSAPSASGEEGVFQEGNDQETARRLTFYDAKVERWGRGISTRRLSISTIC
jgi:hypothetical protein